MTGAYFIPGFFGLVVIGFVGWVIVGEVGERRKARVASRFAGQFQRSGREKGW